MDRLATARVGWSVGKNLTYSSLRPAKSFGLASSTLTSTTFSSVAPAARNMFSQLIKGLSRLLLDRQTRQLVRLGSMPTMPDTYTIGPTLIA